MSDEPIDDPDLEDCMVAAVERGEFATLAEARADFWARLEEAIGQADRGEVEDIETVWARFRARWADLPHAAE